ncbi:MAG: hypothetical protein IPL43_02345 [Micropruina sp.]|nr:hypothetical protein [Micropruina sp.]
MSGLPHERAGGAAESGGHTVPPSATQTLDADDPRYGQCDRAPAQTHFATVADAGTHDLLAVQEMLGHSSPETTRLPQDSLRQTVAVARM